MININKRLKALGDILLDGSSIGIIDVGCDHALLDIYLVKRNMDMTPVGSDIKEGPLEHAKANIEKEGLENKIELRLGDGLSTYKNEDTVIISGMGGRNIIGICKNNMKVLKNIKTFIISPNN